MSSTSTLIALVVTTLLFATAAGDSNDCHPFASDVDSAPCDVKLTSYRCAADVKDPSKLDACPTQFGKPCANATYCPITNRKGVVTYLCPEGGYCPQNTSCVWSCPEGYYCPMLVSDILDTSAVPGTLPTNSSAAYLGPPLPCPAKYFCPAGRSVPIPCRWFEFCGSTTTSLSKPRSQYMGYFGIGALLVVISLVFVGYSHYRGRQEKKIRSEREGESLLTESKRNLYEETNFAAAIPPQQGISIRYDCRGLRLELQQGLFTRIASRFMPHDPKYQPTVILSDVDCCIRNGRVTAIMGPSGSGKTSLMSVLHGKAWSYGTVSGTMLLSGEPVTPALVHRLRPIIGFVPQEDTMTRDATVREVVLFQASGRLPPTTSPEELERQTDIVIESVGLKEHRAKVIGDENRRGISGGQRKRVNVAMEVVTAPSALFLDEPTSGLDATTSLELMDYLKMLAERHHVTVTAVIHQPRWEIFDRFDDLILLAPGGRVVYGGAVAEVESHFARFGFSRPSANVNIADFIMDVVAADSKVRSASGHTVEDLINTHRERFRGDDQPDVRAEGLSCIRMLPSFNHQLSLFLNRSLVLGYLRQGVRILLEILICGAGAIVLSTAMPSVTFFDLQLQFQLGNLLFTLFCHFSALPTFSQTRAVAVRECSSGFSTVAYFLGKDASLLPRVLFMPLIFSVQYTIISPRIEYSDYLICMLGLSYSTFGMGLLLSIALPQDTAQLAAVLVAFVDVLLSGFNPTLDTIWNVFQPMNLPVIGWVLTGLSPIRWSLDLLSSGEYLRNSEFWRLCMSNKMWPSGYDPNKDGFGAPIPFKILALFGLGLLFRAGTLLVLAVRHRQG